MGMPDIGSLLSDALSQVEHAGISAVQQATSGGSSSSSKATYDSYRQTVWNMFVKLFDSVTVYRQQGLLDRVGLQQYINALSTMMATFKRQTDAVASQIGTSWVTPRFHDYYDTMNNALNSWRDELATLPMTGLVDSILGNTITPPPPSNQPGSMLPGGPLPPTVNSIANAVFGNPVLILGLAVGAVMLLGRKNR